MPIPFEVIPSFLFYSYIGAITPGPANILSLSTSLKDGKRAAFEQWTGIFTGFFIDSMLAVIFSYFLGAALNDRVRYLSFVGAAYLCYLAISLLRESSPSKNQGDSAAAGKKPTFLRHFLRGLFLQLTNIKVILLCFTSLSSFVLPYNQDFSSLLLVGLFLPLTGPVANLLWIFAGLSLQRLFTKHAKIVGLVMAASLFLCAASLVMTFLSSSR